MSEMLGHRSKEGLWIGKLSSASARFRLPASMLVGFVCLYQVVSSWNALSREPAILSLCAGVPGISLRTWALLYMGSRNNGEGRTLTGGPFRLVRHPRYLANLLMLAAFPIAAGRASGLESILGFSSFFVIHMLTAWWETSQLRKGPEEDRWIREVGAILPFTSLRRLRRPWTAEDRIRWHCLSWPFMWRHMLPLAGISAAYGAVVARGLNLNI